MAAVSWKNPVNGDWTVAADWSTGKVPGAGDDVRIAAPGSYTVSLTTPITAHSITIGPVDAILDIADPGKVDSVIGNFADSGGTLEVDAAGAGGSTLNIGGTLTNSGDLDIG